MSTACAPPPRQCHRQRRRAGKRQPASMSPPHAALVVDGRAPQSHLHAAIRAACRQLLSGWQELPDDSIDISFIAGGISNALFKVCPASAAAGGTEGAASLPPPVAFRVYGDNTERFIDRDRELDIMNILHEHGFGPQVVATFNNGRIEEFLPMRSLEPEEMAAPKFVPIIATTLRQFHSIPVPLPGAKQARTPFARIFEWLDIAENFTFEDPKKQQAFAAFDFAALRVEVRTVEAAAALMYSPVVFGHNDLLSGNLMVPLATSAFSTAATAANGVHGSTAACSSSVAANEAASKQRAMMTFIDFEYADWAPRGFDLGNHFCEYAGNDCDYTQYPGQQQAALFIRHYLAAGSSSLEAVDEAEVVRCVAEANLYALAAHQYWGTWGLLQAKWSSIDFDYMLFATNRWAEYHRRKDEFMAAAALLFNQPE